jgi:15-cis-phytoene synthase
MSDPLPIPISGAKRLALAYARPLLRERLAVLLAFDARMADVVRQTKEPLIAQMRFAWWRDILAKPVGNRPAGEPLLQYVAVLADRAVEAELTSIIDAWELLLSFDDNHDVILQHGRLRSDAIFSGFADVVEHHGDVQEYGSQWAIADLIVGFPQHLDDALPLLKEPKLRFARLPRQLRPLAILHYAANLELQQMVDGGRGQSGSSFRLLFGALTGR